EEESPPLAAQAEATQPMDPAAQLLALAQQAQQLAQGKEMARGETRDGLAQAGGDRRGQGARGAQRLDALAAPPAEELLEADAASQATPKDFLDHLSDAQALQ